MNILLLHSSSDLYGASKILLYTVEAMVSQNNHVCVMLEDDGLLVDELKKRGANVEITNLGVLRRKYFNLSGILNRVREITQAHKYIKSFIRKNKISLVYSNTTAVLVGAFAAKGVNVKHIWHVHEIITTPKIFAWIIGKMLDRYSARIIVVSDAVRKHWLKYVHGDKIKTIHNGIEYSEFLSDGPSIDNELNRQKETIVIGMIGRVHYWKGQEYFLRIAEILHRNNRNILFVMVGDAYNGYEYLYDKLAKFKKSLSLEHVVRDLGFRTDIPNILRSFDIFVLPSILPDPFPTVILEAMASAKVVVATNLGGVTEMIVDKESGYLIPWDNEYQAANIIEEIIHRTHLRKQIGKNARERVVNYFSSQAFRENLLTAIKII
jgi:glycosyltransferase involved in cell wall biosynthesis